MFVLCIISIHKEKLPVFNNRVLPAPARFLHFACLLLAFHCVLRFVCAAYVGTSEWRPTLAELVKGTSAPPWTSTSVQSDDATYTLMEFVAGDMPAVQDLNHHTFVLMDDVGDGVEKLIVAIVCVFTLRTALYVRGCGMSGAFSEKK